jgi:tetratricopeptide (TPR) repeat protein
MIALLVFALLTPSAEAARTHFAKGQKLFNDQRYKDALGEFEAAQKSAPREVADLYFNIGQCNRNLGRTRAAIAAFERYLELKPDAPDRKQVRQMLGKLRAKLPPDNDTDAPTDEGQVLAEIMASPAVEKEKPAPEKPAVEPAAAVVVPETAPQPAPKPVKLELPHDEAPPSVGSANAVETPVVHQPLYEKWWFWAGMGMAVLGTTAGLYAGLHHNPTAPPLTMQMLGSAGTFDTRPH